MRYKCIVIDHDDTVAATTEEIHYPSFKKSLKAIRPQLKISFEEYINYSFEPGFECFLKEILELNGEEMRLMYDNWEKDTKDITAIFYKEIKDFLLDFHSKNGLIAVATHSNRARVEKDYMFNLGFIPYEIFAWELGKDKRKPSPYAVKEIMSKYKLKPEEILVIDDLKPGLDMAKSAGVDFLWAAWAYNKPLFHEYMIKNSTYCIENLDKIKEFFDEDCK